jgi:hypothetical protein
MKLFCRRCMKLREHGEVACPYTRHEARDEGAQRITARCLTCGKLDSEGFKVPGNTPEEALAWVKAQE